MIGVGFLVREGAPHRPSLVLASRTVKPRHHLVRHCNLSREEALQNIASFFQAAYKKP